MSTLDLTRRDLLLGAGGAAATLSPLSALAADELKLRLWSDDDNTRISIESAKKLDFNHFLLRNTKPYRLVVDIKNQRLTVGLERGIKSLQLNDAFVSSVRPGQFKDDTLRFVFDLKNDVNAEVHYAKPVANYQHRIILTLTPTNADVMKRVIDESAKELQVAKKPEKPNTVKETQAKAEPKPKPKKTSGKAETLIVVIDPGHGGEDPGAVGRKKTYEKNVVLAISKKLADMINRTKGMRAVLTRNRDVFLPLSKRAAVAVKEHAHIFVSIHADAWISADAQGSSVFTLSTGQASSLQARWLAQSQNRADEIGGITVKDVPKTAQSTLVDLLADVKLRYGIQLGDFILKELSKLGPLHKSSVEYADFAVLKAQGIPSILIETAFISNPKEEQRLRNSNHQAKFAKAIYDGIRTAVKKDSSLVRPS
ncbi:MAG: N-acetylmuramoyl-L-alanine amidase [Sutterellaceae bacterium]|nr:N-acetylmuramoyl-L-alanine amidase [Sutterellaceae bacterium]